MSSITQTNLFFNALESLSSDKVDSHSSSQEIALKILNNGEFTQGIIDDLKLNNPHLLLVKNLSHNPHMDKLRPALQVLLEYVASYEKEQDLRAKDGHLWVCVGRKKDNESGGYIYQFQIRDQYLPPNNCDYSKDAANKLLEIFPAVEYPEGDLVKKIIGKANLVGFECRQNTNNYQFLVPDEKVIEYRWYKERSRNPNLPNLRIASVEGISSDEEYVRTFIESDIIISKGIEFMHDVSVHLMSLINEILDNPAFEYKTLRIQAVAVIKEIYNKIKFAEEHVQEIGITHKDTEKLMFLLGFMTDTIFASGREMMNSLVKNGIELFPTRGVNAFISNKLGSDYEKLMSNYLSKRFPGEIFPSAEHLQSVWDKIIAFNKLKKGF